MPASVKQQQFIANARRQLRAVLTADDPRLALIIGPCSIHDIHAAKEYAQLLAKLAHEVSSHFLVIMRVYFEKARTLYGWKGLLYDPHLDGSHALLTGIKQTRQLLLDLAEEGVATAAEFLDPVAALYFQDLITWGCIGARTSSSQIHRQLAAALPMPVGFKNSTEGDIETAVHGALAAAVPHSYLGVTPEGSLAAISAPGNSHSHIVLRGANKSCNYEPDAVGQALNVLQRLGLSTGLFIDCSHGNAQKSHTQQEVAFRSVITQVSAGNEKIRGLLIESHIHAGSQLINCQPSGLRYAVSITDPCIDWATSERLVLWAAELLALPAPVATAATG